MNKLDQKLQEIKETKKIGLMTHVVVGYPSLDETEELLQIMEEYGVDMVELQIPFSDPLADGTTIMHASESALRSGVKVHDAFAIAEKLQGEVSIPLLFMCYYNTVFVYGVKEFCRDAKRVGISGLIVPDMPFDEEQEEHFYAFAKRYGLHVIQVISPATPKKRLQKIAKIAKGFVYCTARQGITGVRNGLDSHLNNYLQTVRQYIKIPLAVGFGISQKEHVEALIGKADIAVIGSKLLDIIDNSKDYKKEFESFLKQVNMLE